MAHTLSKEEVLEQVRLVVLSDAHFAKDEGRKWATGAFKMIMKGLRGPLGGFINPEHVRQAATLLNVYAHDELTAAARNGDVCQYLRDNEQRILNIISGKGESNTSKGSCYIATAVYGSYDCPQVWTLRRYRDNTLARNVFGRAFIHTYYAVSPTLVRLFGQTQWFTRFWRGRLDKLVTRLQKDGYADTPYDDTK
jgi:hypothetical protein